MKGKQYRRREVLKGMSAACAAYLAPIKIGALSENLQIAGQDVEVQVITVSRHTFRLSVIPVKNGRLSAIPMDGSLVKDSWGEPILKFRNAAYAETFRAGELTVQIGSHPLTFAIQNQKSAKIQQLTVDENTGTLLFETGDSPLLGLGEGGQQFDRRGFADSTRNGQGGYKLGTHGSRVSIPWVIGAGGWAMFVHQPYGAFDFTGTQSKFIPASLETALPLDIFFIGSREPATIMAEYARLTGHAQIPPLWSLGYQQSHRTLASLEEILEIANTFREKKLPCDALIYLGTGFCPSGWNTANGSFAWNSRVFPDPVEILKEFHMRDFHAVMHAVILTRKLSGSARDGCAVGRFDEQEAGCYWDAHRKDFAMGIDGWWPDEGDALDIPSRLTRNRMYWEGPQIDRPNERPYALHRNGYAGMQRYASFLWSGDVYSTWETLRTHIPNAINTALSGIPYWGTDIGGFVPTKEFTAELYLRWFQFGAFCTLFRSHGRAWKLRLPWGWDTGETGPKEISNYSGASLPDESELHNKQVEPICRKYLELRYRMLPYTYSAVRECSKTGMPIIRALWLHYPDDAVAIAHNDEYLWGRDILVAPVCEKGAASRRVYLPRGDWYDFWSGERTSGGREITRAVNLEVMPLFIRAGAILPLSPVKQHTGEKKTEPLAVTIYPGGKGSFLLYEDDGKSFDYRRGQWMGIEMAWNDARRVLDLRLATGSRMMSPMRRDIEISCEQVKKRIIFDGHAIEVHV